jgi:SAM-dependent MidA family methyltransferase
MTPLEEIIHRQIERFGLMPVSEYMTLCLLHPEHGYYITRDALGAKGDFTTSPEISQMFGELLGLSLAQAWLDQGQPAPFILAEVGPGNGTLMADVLRATKGIPEFQQDMELILIEASPSMRARQKTALLGHKVRWCDSLSDLPEHPLFLIANEFFDCMPIKQFRRTTEGWQEQMIGAQNGELHFALGKAIETEAFPQAPDLAVGQMFETSSASAAHAEMIARHIGAHGGGAIIIDYGDWVCNGDSLQAVKDHKQIDALSHCGHADLTAHVSFSDLSGAAEPFAQVSAMTTQGVLLERLGITQRAQALANTMDGDALENHITAHNRLTHPSQMGTLFKAIAIAPHGKPLPAGFTI